MVTKEFKLKVAEALHSDVGRGIVRLSSDSAEKLGVITGDIVEITGKKTTVAKVWQAHPQDEGQDIIRMDGILRQNTGTSLGDKVAVKKAEVADAKKVTIAPTRHEISFGGDFANYVKQKVLMGRPLLEGDNFIISVLGQSISFTAAATKPKGAVQVTETTEIDIRSNAPAYPIDLQLLYRFRPIHLPQIFQQLFSVLGYSQHPLAHRLSDYRMSAAFTYTTNYFFVS